MKKTILLFMAVLISGCANDALLSQLRLEDGEIGSICVRGSIDLNPVPFMTSTANFVYKESSSLEYPPAEC